MFLLILNQKVCIQKSPLLDLIIRFRDCILLFIFSVLINLDHLQLLKEDIFIHTNFAPLNVIVQDVVCALFFCFLKIGPAYYQSSKGKSDFENIRKWLLREFEVLLDNIDATMIVSIVMSSITLYLFCWYLFFILR